MNKLIYIWSKDRSAQLENLLNSIQKHFLDFDIHILYTFSSTLFKEGYDKLIKEYKDLKWSFQENATEQFFNSINNYEIVGLMTDDCHLFSNTSEIDLTDVGCFSLRLGLNTVVQDHFIKSYQPYLTKYTNEGNTIKWSINQFAENQNYGYPFSIDGHFYRSHLLKKIIDFKFNNPPELESQLFYKRHLINPLIRANKQSCIVNVPLSTSNSGYTRSMGVLQEYLNDEFLKGKRLRYLEEKIVGCHQNLEWRLI